MMHKNSLIVSGALLAAISLPLAAAYAGAKFVLFDPPSQRCSDELLPEGETYHDRESFFLDMIRRTKALYWEDIAVTANDGARLVGHYHHTADNAPIAICFHGYKGTAFRDFSGGARLLAELGHNVLLVDQRGQGKSGGKYMSFGILERKDVLSWTEYVLHRFGSDVPIFLYGISMGAATVVMASGLALPDNVMGIVADCPYSSPKEIIETVSAGMGIPPRAAYNIIRLGGKLYGGFDLSEASAAEAVKHTKVPVLLIHGEADGFVPCEMSRAIYDANPEMVRMETFPGAQHGISFISDSERYKHLVTDFLKNARK